MNMPWMQAPALDGVVRYQRIGVQQRFDVVTFGRIDHRILSKINNGDPDTDYNGAVSEQPFAVQWTVIFGSAVDGRRCAVQDQHLRPCGAGRPLPEPGQPRPLDSRPGLARAGSVW